jgi:hypothetical protein
MEELRAKTARLVSEEGRRAGLAFVPRPTDVVIAPFGKCGTTWLQQIVHSLRTGGDLDFDDISRVVPWIETAADLGIDLDAKQRGEPRAFKSHLSWDDVPKGARYIVVVRNPGDALVASYRFLEGWFFEPGSIDIDTFARARFLESRGYYTHLGSWWPRRHDDDVLLLAYEQMKDNLERSVRHVARFIGIDADEERIAVACSQASYESMRLHKDKYDDLLMRLRSEEVCDIPRGGDSSKVRTGRVGDHRRELPDALLDSLGVTWHETIETRFGLPTYDDLLAELTSSAWQGTRDA